MNEAASIASPWLAGFFLVSGIILLWLEFFLPGGVLGVLGGILLVTGIVLVYIAYGSFWGSMAALGSLLLVGGLLASWMKNFQGTFFGKRMLNADAVGDDEYIGEVAHLVGKRGRAHSDLRPSGKAVIDGKKFDVVSQLGVVEKDTEIIVVKVNGISIVVRAVDSVP